MLLTRFKGNPILAPSSHTWENKAVFNCGVVTYQGDIHLIYRAQGEDEISRLGLVRMTDPTQIGERKAQPVFSPDPDSEYEVRGVEDPRITQMGDDFYMIYTAASKYPPLMKDHIHARDAEWRARVSLAKTTDFANFSRYGVIISHIDSKDAALFPEKIDNNLCMVHRVIPQVRIAVAPDGRNYKERGPIFGPREGTWDESRVGVGAPPIKCPHGWLLFYHGVDNARVYRLGLALLDLHDPSLVLARTVEPILEPAEDYERAGRVKNVVFTCGVVEDNDKYWIYYGGADMVIGVASVPKAEVWQWAKDEQSQSQYHKSDHIGKITTDETAERVAAIDHL